MSWLDIVKQNVGFLNPGQTPVIAFDQPLYALAKQIKWNWPNIYGEDKVVIMFGGIHIEMAALRTIGDWLEESGWTSALVEADLASPGTAYSFLKASHLTRTRHAYQVTASSLCILMSRVMSNTQRLCQPMKHHRVASDVWHEQWIKESPHFQYWSTTLDFELSILSFVRSLQEGNFQLYIEALDSLLHLFFVLNHPNYSRWLFEDSVQSVKQKQSQGPDVKYHEQVKSVQATFAKQVKALRGDGKSI